MPGYLSRLVPAAAAGRDEQVRHPVGLEEVEHAGVRRRAQAVEDREDLVLQHQLADHLLGVGRVVAVVHDLVGDLAAVHAAVGVDVVEVRLGGRRDLRVAGRGRAGQRHVRADQDLGVGHARDGCRRAEPPPPLPPSAATAARRRPSARPRRARDQVRHRSFSSILWCDGSVLGAGVVVRRMPGVGRATRQRRHRGRALDAAGAASMTTIRRGRRAPAARLPSSRCASRGRQRRSRR